MDTEQSRFHCHNVLERILRLAGCPPRRTTRISISFACGNTPPPSVSGYRLCPASEQGYGLVIIDGIRDLMLDINSTSESVEVINKMMEWSSKYDLHIHCVLHLNKGDNNVRGHIGTEMSNKAETVLVITKKVRRIPLSVKFMRCISARRSSNRSPFPLMTKGCRSWWITIRLTAV